MGCIALHNLFAIAKSGRSSAVRPVGDGSPNERRNELASEEAEDVGATVIRKYANRRLYNTDTASFVTLEDLHEMVKQGVSFVVQDATTGRDITCSVLAQIISEEESRGRNLLPLNYLRQVLQLYDAGFGPQFRAYLEQSVDAFTANQQQVVQQMQRMLAGDGAVEQFAEIGRRNLEIFQRSMNMFTPPAANRRQDDGDGPAPADERQPPSRDREIEDLKRQLAEMQQRLDSLSGPK